MAFLNKSKNLHEENERLQQKIDSFKQNQTTPDHKVGGESVNVKGRTTNSKFTLGNLSVNRVDARLSNNQLRRIYRQSSSVRPCVDSIVRDITTLPWDVVPVDEMNYEQKHIDEVLQLLLNPNVNNENLQQILVKILTDVMVLDAGALEKVWNLAKTRVLELFARDGASIVPKVDEYGVLHGYGQTINGAKAAEFEPDELIYLMLYPNSVSPYGTPVMDTIVDEVPSLLFSNKFIADSFTLDEIPQGILNLGNIGFEAYERVKASFEEKAGQRSKQEMNVIYGTENPSWIGMTRANRDMQLDELRRSIERVVFRNFGVTPVEMGEVQDMPRATAQAQLIISRSKLMRPLVQLLMYFINTEIIKSFGYTDVMYKIYLEPPEDKEKLSMAFSRLIRAGVLSPNDARRELNKPVNKEIGGDRRFVEVGGKMYFIDELRDMDSTVLMETAKINSTNGFEEKKNKETDDIDENIDEDIDTESEDDDIEEEIKKKVENDFSPKGKINSVDVDLLLWLQEEYKKDMLKKFNSSRDKVVKYTLKHGKQKRNKLILSNKEIQYVRKEFRLLKDEMKEVAQIYFPFAEELSINATKQMYGYNFYNINVPTRLDLLYNKHDHYILRMISQIKARFMKTLKGGYRIGDFKPALKMVYKLEFDDFEEGLNQAYNSSAWRFDQYKNELDGVNSEVLSQQVMMGREAGIAFWHLNSSNPCHDCISFAAGGPYKINDLSALPGDGTTICVGKCQCNLVIQRTGQPVLPRTITSLPAKIRKKYPEIYAKMVGIELSVFKERVLAQESIAGKKIITKSELSEIFDAKLFGKNKKYNKTLTNLFSRNLKYQSLLRKDLLSKIKRIEIVSGFTSDFNSITGVLRITKSELKNWLFTGHELAHVNEVALGLSTKTKVSKKLMTMYNSRIDKLEKLFAKKGMAPELERLHLWKEATKNGRIYVEDVTWNEFEDLFNNFTLKEKGVVSNYSFRHPSEMYAENVTYYLNDSNRLNNIKDLIPIIEGTIK